MKTLFTGVLAVFAYEIAEEVLEEVIATGISLVIMKTLSTFLLVALTIPVKMLIKRIIKTITYKEGNDKMEKLKSFVNWVVANKKSLSSTASSAFIAGSGIAVSWAVDGLPAIDVGGFNIAPILYTLICLACFALNELGVCGKGFEKIAVYASRISAEKEVKEARAIEKAAAKEVEKSLKAQEAEAKAVEEAARKKIEADEKAKLEAERAEKIAQKAAELLSQKSDK